MDSVVVPTADVEQPTAGDTMRDIGLQQLNALARREIERALDRFRAIVALRFPHHPLGFASWDFALQEACDVHYALMDEPARVIHALNLATIASAVKPKYVQEGPTNA